jgi:hypothetical protein
MIPLPKYLANGSGRDSYIIRTLGGGHTDKATFDERPRLKVDRLFGRLPDQELKKMYKAQRGDPKQRMKEL